MLVISRKQVPPIEPQVSDKKLGEGNARIHPLAFFNEEFFWHHKKEDAEKKYPSGVARGAIIPHHLLPGEILSGTLSQLSSPNIRTVILIGPNHYERGKTSILTETASWETPFGILESDPSLMQELLKESFVSEDFDGVQKEHSIAGIVPYIRYSFPNARVVPIVVSRKIAEEEKQSLISVLADRSKRADTLVVAAVDFSHNLLSEETRKKNAESLSVMQDRSYQTLLSYGNGHVDSPESIELFLRIMDAIGADNLNVLYDTDSGRLTGNMTAPVTSYFGIVATLPQK